MEKSRSAVPVGKFIGATAGFFPETGGFFQGNPKARQAATAARRRALEQTPEGRLMKKLLVFLAPNSTCKSTITLANLYKIIYIYKYIHISIYIYRLINYVYIYIYIYE